MHKKATLITTSQSLLKLKTQANGACVPVSTYLQASLNDWYQKNQERLDLESAVNQNDIIFNFSVDDDTLALYRLFVDDMINNLINPIGQEKQ